MTITTTNDIIAPILQSLAPGMLAVPTPDFIYRIPADRDTMPRQGGTTMRFLRPRLLSPPIVALGNSGIEPPSQVPQRDIKDAIMSFYSTSVILDLFGIVKSLLIDLEGRTDNTEADRAQAILGCAA